MKLRTAQLHREGSIRDDLGEKEEDCFKAIQEAEILNASQSRFGCCAVLFSVLKDESTMECS